MRYIKNFISVNNCNIPENLANKYGLATIGYIYDVNGTDVFNELNNYIKFHNIDYNTNDIFSIYSPSIFLPEYYNKYGYWLMLFKISNQIPLTPFEQTIYNIKFDNNIDNLRKDYLEKRIYEDPTFKSDVKKTDNINIFYRKIEDKVYGFVTDDNILYLDKDSLNDPNTLFHEFYHLYDKILLSNSNEDTQAYTIIKRANELIDEHGYLKDVQNDINYKHLSLELQQIEARALMIGDYAENRFNNNKIFQLINDIIEYIKALFDEGTFDDYTNDEILKMDIINFNNVVINTMIGNDENIKDKDLNKVLLNKLKTVFKPYYKEVTFDKNKANSIRKEYEKREKIIYLNQIILDNITKDEYNIVNKENGGNWVLPYDNKLILDLLKSNNDSAINLLTELIIESNPQLSDIFINNDNLIKYITHNLNMDDIELLSNLDLNEKEFNNFIIERNKKRVYDNTKHFYISVASNYFKYLEYIKLINDSVFKEIYDRLNNTSILSLEDSVYLYSIFNKEFKNKQEITKELNKYNIYKNYANSIQAMFIKEIEENPELSLNEAANKLFNNRNVKILNDNVDYFELRYPIWTDYVDNFPSINIKLTNNTLDDILSVYTGELYFNDLLKYDGNIGFNLTNILNKRIVDLFETDEMENEYVKNTVVSLVNKEIMNNSKFRKDIQELFNKSINKNISYGINFGVNGEYYNGLQNIKDFVVESLTNERFISYLKSLDILEDVYDKIDFYTNVNTQTNNLERNKEVLQQKYQEVLKLKDIIDNINSDSIIELNNNNFIVDNNTINLTNAGFKLTDETIDNIVNVLNTFVNNVLKKFSKNNNVSDVFEFFQESNNNNFDLSSQQRQNIQELKQLEPEYAKGTDEQVQEFIESIYPESVMKDIVYHATDVKFNKFDKDLSVRKNTNKKHQGWYFTKLDAKGFVEKNLGRTNLIELPVLLDMRNPYAVDDLDDLGEKLSIDSRFITESDLQKLRNNNFDSVYTTYPLQKRISDAAELVVFEPEQITILNSPETIQKWNEFLSLGNKKENKISLENLDLSKIEIVADLNKNVYDRQVKIPDILFRIKQLDEIKSVSPIAKFLFESNMFKPNWSVLKTSTDIKNYFQDVLKNKDFWNIDKNMLVYPNEKQREQWGLNIHNANEYPEFTLEALQSEEWWIEEIDELNRLRKHGFNEWAEILNNNFKEYPEFIILVQKSLTNDYSIKSDRRNSNVPPLNLIMLNKIFDILNNGEKAVTSTKTFKQLYESLILEEVAKKGKIDSVDGLNTKKGYWITIEQYNGDTEHDQKSKSMLITLSYNSWCTKSTMADTYLRNGDFHIYIEPDETNTSDNIDDIISGVKDSWIKLGGGTRDGRYYLEGQSNNGKIPYEYINQIREFYGEKDTYILKQLENAIKEHRKVEDFREKGKEIIEAFALLNETGFTDTMDYLEKSKSIWHRNPNGTIEVDKLYVENEDVELTLPGIHFINEIINVRKMYVDNIDRNDELIEWFIDEGMYDEGNSSYAFIDYEYAYNTSLPDLLVINQLTFDTNSTIYLKYIEDILYSISTYTHEDLRDGAQSEEYFALLTNFNELLYELIPYRFAKNIINVNFNDLEELLEQVKLGYSKYVEFINDRYKNIKYIESLKVNDPNLTFKNLLFFNNISYNRNINLSKQFPKLNIDEIKSIDDVKITSKYYLNDIYNTYGLNISVDYVNDIAAVIKNLLKTKNINSTKDIFLYKIDEGNNNLLRKLNTKQIQAYYNKQEDKVYIDKKVYESDESKKVLIHELVGHQGLAKLFKGEDKQTYENILFAAENYLMQNLDNLLAKTGHTSLNQLVQDYFLDLNKKEDKLKLIEELLARQAEDEPSLSWFQQLIGKLQLLLAKVFGLKKPMSKEGVIELLLMSQKAQKTNLTFTDQIKDFDKNKQSLFELYRKKVETINNNLQIVANESQAIDIATSEQRDDVKKVIDSINVNLLKRLGITEEEYAERAKIFKTPLPIINENIKKELNILYPLLESFQRSFDLELNQPNEEYKNILEKNPKVKALNFSDSIHDRWIVKYLITTEKGRAILNQAKTKEDAIFKLNEIFNLLGEEIKTSDKYFLTELSDELIEKNLNSVEAKLDEQFRQTWEHFKEKKEEKIKERNKEQRENMMMNYATFSNSSHYSIGFKLLILESLLKRDTTYNKELDKGSDKPRDNSTISTPPILNEAFLAETEEKASKSSNKIMFDYFYEQANYKEIKIDVEEYKQNIFQITPKGTWYKFQGEKDLDRFHKMSSLSAMYPGAWCTKGYDTAKQYLLSQESSSLYIFYSTSENNPTLQLHFYENEAVEIGGLAAGQDFRTNEDFEVFEEFLNTNKKLNAGKLKNYLDYKKAIIKGEKQLAKGEELNLSLQDWDSIVSGKKYYKDKSNLLEKYKKMIPKSYVVEKFNVPEHFVVTMEEYEKSDLDKSELYIIGDFFSFIPTYDEPKPLAKFILGNAYFNSLKTATTQIVGNIGGNAYFNSLKTATTQVVGNVGGNADFSSLKTATTQIVGDVEGDAYFDNLEVANTQIVGNVGGNAYFYSLKTLHPQALIKDKDGNFIINKEVEGIIIGLPYKKDKKDKEDKELNQDNKGLFLKRNNITYTVFGKGSDLTTAIHEKAHEYEQVLTKEEIKVLEEWSGYKQGTTEFSEAFAKGAEKVIYDGLFAKEDTLLSNIFKKFVKWFKELITDAIDYFGSINELNEEVREVYAKMFIGESVSQQQISELFESNPELANAVYSKILTNSGLSAENLLSLLLKDNLIEKQCS